LALHAHGQGAGQGHSHGHGGSIGYLEALPGVARLHDLHIWPMSTTETALTCHLVMPGVRPADDFIVGVTPGLRERYGIGHATIQIETSEAIACALEPDSVV